jgi:hypothetical protein
MKSDQCCVAIAFAYIHNWQNMQCSWVILVEPVRWLKAHGKIMIIIHYGGGHVEIWKVSNIRV